MRECGNCTWCCFFMASKELEMGVNEWCKHCSPGDGCNIHSERPQVCRDFSCLWLSQEQIPASLRPDLCGIVFEQPAGTNHYVGYMDPDRHRAWEDPETRRFIDKINQAGHSVVVVSKPGDPPYYSLAQGDYWPQVHEDLFRALVKHLADGVI